MLMSGALKTGWGGAGAVHRPHALRSAPRQGSLWFRETLQHVVLHRDGNTVRRSLVSISAANQLRGVITETS